MALPIYHSQYTAAQIEASIGKTPTVNLTNRTWMVWDIATSQYVDTGVPVDTEILIDKTLSLEGAAADAGEVGNRAILGTGKMITTQAIADEQLNGDLDNATINRIYSIGSSNLSIDNLPYTGFVGQILTCNYSQSASGSRQIAMSSYYQGNRLFTRANTNGIWNPWEEFATKAETTSLITTNAIIRWPNMIVSATSLVEVTGGTNNADDFPSNRLIYVSGSAPSFVNQIKINGNGGGYYITLYYGTASNRSGAMQLFICGKGGIATRLNANGNWGSWIIMPKETAISDMIAQFFVTAIGPAIEGASITRWGTMILNEQTLSDLTDGSKSADDFPLNKIIYVSSALGAFTNSAAISGDGGGYYLTLCYSGNEIHDGAMQLFFGRNGGVSARVRSLGEWRTWVSVVPNEIKTYRVGPTRNYKTLTELWLALDGDTSEKIVFVDPGEYDVFQEYRDNDVPSPPEGTSTSNYKPYCVNIPSNTKLIGCGNVVLKWLPDSEDITELESQIWSPVNVHADEFYMENFTVICGNGRYCIHDDPHNAFPGCHHVYKNLRLQRPGRDEDRGFSMVVGMGYCDKGRYEFENLVMDNQIDANNGYCIGGHEGATGASAGANDGATVVFKDCVMNAVGLNSMRFQTINSAAGAQQRIRVSINGCYLNKRIWLDKYASGSHQFFDLTLLHSGNPEFYIEDQNNPWPPKIYP